MPENTRDQLIKYAEILVRTRGYAGFSYAHLAEAASLSKASIHHYFPTKEDLGLVLVDVYRDRYDKALGEIKRKTQDCIKRVEAYADLYLHGLEDERGCLAAALATELGILPDTIRDAVANFFRRHVAWLKLVLIEGRASGTVREDINPAQHARMIVATLEGALLMERLLNGPAGFKDTLRALRKSLK